MNVNKLESDKISDPPNNTPSQSEEEENSASYGGKECTMCNYVPESIIFLSCEHIICLICAAKLILSGSEDKDFDFSEVECGICHEVTDLSKEVQETLLEFLNNGNIEFESDEEEEDEEEEAESDQEEKEDENQDQSQENKEVDIEEEVKKEMHSELSKSERHEEEDNIEQQENESEEEECEISEEEEEEEKDSGNNELSVSFACQNHIGEEYTFYNMKLKTLYCNQCLLNEKINQTDMDSVKPLKKCFPEILQNFQDMLNKVEVCKNLLENKHKNFEIRKSNAKTQSQSYIKKYDIITNELIDQLKDIKNRSMKKLENMSEEMITQLQDKESDYEAKIDYFNAIMEQISEFKKNSENPEEEIFSFFFANQHKIYEALDEEKQEDQEKAEKIVFNEFETRLKEEYNSLLRLNYQDVRSKADQCLSKLNTKVTTLLTQNDKNDMNESIHQSYKTSRNITHNSSRFYREPELKERPNYSKFLQKIRQQSASFKERPQSVDPERNNNHTRVNTRSRLANLPHELASNNIFASYFNRPTEDKRSYNLQKKLDLEKKLKLFEFRSKKDDFLTSGKTVVNFRKNKQDSLSYKLDQLKNQLRMRSNRPSLNYSIKMND